MKEESILAWSIFTPSIKTDSDPESCARCCLPVQRLDKDRKTRFGGVVNRNARLSCFSSSNIVSSRGSEVATCQPCRMPLGGRSHQSRRWLSVILTHIVHDDFVDMKPLRFPVLSPNHRFHGEIRPFRYLYI